MSLKAVDWAFEQRVFPATRKLILLALADDASVDDGIAFPSLKTLCQKTGLEEDTVRKGLSDLCESALIVDTGRRAGSTGKIKIFQFPEEVRRTKTPDSKSTEKQEDLTLTECQDNPRSIPVQSPINPGTIPDQSPIPCQTPNIIGKRKEEGGKGNIYNGRTRPSMEEVILFCSEIDLSAEAGRWFFDKCEGNGWKNGGTAIKDWMATLRSWKRAGYIPSKFLMPPPPAPSDGVVRRGGWRNGK